PTAEAQIHQITNQKTQISYGQQKETAEAQIKDTAQGPQPATPGLLWTRGKEAEPNTRKNLAHPPATCRPPQLRPPILAQPPTLSTVTPFPPELRAYRASAPSDFFDALSSRRRSGVGRTEKASTLPRDKTGDDGSSLHLPGRTTATCTPLHLHRDPSERPHRYSKTDSPLMENLGFRAPTRQTDDGSVKRER
ncbi:LOW QUALITY PROTEIN: hypothetical protein HID58_010955, partial [Brassica napus]